LFSITLFYPNNEIKCVQDSGYLSLYLTKNKIVVGEEVASRRNNLSFTQAE